MRSQEYFPTLGALAKPWSVPQGRGLPLLGSASTLEPLPSPVQAASLNGLMMVLVVQWGKVTSSGSSPILFRALSFLRASVLETHKSRFYFFVRQVPLAFSLP